MISGILDYTTALPIEYTLLGMQPSLIEPHRRGYCRRSRDASMSALIVAIEIITALISLLFLYEQDLRRSASSLVPRRAVWPS